MKLMTLINALLVVLGCQPVFAEPVSKITVFYADDVPIINDINNEYGTFLRIHNMSTNINAIKRINGLVGDQVRGKVINSGNVEDIYLEAFSKVQNGPEWHDLYGQFEKGGLAIERAIKIGITKLPAIVINDRYVIYGEPSIRNSIDIFLKWGESNEK